MATPFTGRYCAISIGGTTTSYINNLGRWELNITMDEMDASVFGTVWKKNMTGMQGWNGTIEGFFDPSTAAPSQVATLMSAALNASKVQDIRFYLNTATSMFFWPTYTTIFIGGTGSTDAGAYLSNIRVGAEKNSLISFSASVLGYKGIALISGTSAPAGVILVQAT